MGRELNTPSLSLPTPHLYGTSPRHSRLLLQKIGERSGELRQTHPWHLDLHRGLGSQKSGGRTEELKVLSNTERRYFTLPENWQLGLQHKQISNISMIKILVPAKGNILILPSKYLKAVLNEIQPKSATKPGQA